MATDFCDNRVKWEDQRSQNGGSMVTYKDAGVDIDKADKFVKNISTMIKRTYRKEVLTDIGLFSGAFDGNIIKEMKSPVLISGTDGVGTKIKIACIANKHNTIGIDLVAMCVNDILTTGGEPLFFLDYFSTSKLDEKRDNQIIEGIVKGCVIAGCALIGGETAEMPGFYNVGEYDLSGFVVGVIDKDKIVDGKNIEKGDVVIGIVSNKLHSNGFSLIRKIFSSHELIEKSEEFLAPTLIYKKAVDCINLSK